MGARDRKKNETKERGEKKKGKEEKIEYIGEGKEGVIFLFLLFYLVQKEENKKINQIKIKSRKEGKRNCK